MNNTNQEQQELDDFFNWLLPLIPKKERKQPPPPSQELLDMACEVAQAHQDYLWEHGLYHERIIARAAADGSHKTAPIKYDSLSGDWSLTREDIVGDTESQILKFKCREELIEKFQGMIIKVLIADSLYDLGAVNRRGIAEADIPYGLDIQQIQDVYFRTSAE